VAKRDMEEGRGRARGLTLGTYLRRWLEALVTLGSVSERTLQDYRYYAEKHLIPGLGTLALDDLSAEDFDSLYVRLAKDGMGPRSINHVHSTARVALQRAVKKRLIPHNPVRDADPPRYSTDEREYRTLSEEDVARFFDAAAGDRYEALWIVSVLSGLRPAELRGLKWEDLKLPDSGEGSATVHRTSTELKGEKPKLRNTTKSGKPRVVPLLPEAVNALKEHRARQNEERLRLGNRWEDGGLVFPTTTGTVTSRANLTNRNYKPILKKAGLPDDVRLYDLRHTFATLWVESGEDHKILQGILGHARISTTLDRYVHPSEWAHKEAMSRFGARLRKGP
jgi:integrase